MTIGREEAAQALKDAEAAADRSTAAISYGRASPHLILWGVVWVTGNLAAFLRMPLNGNVVFPALMLAGVAGSIVLGVRGGRGPGGAAPVLRAVAIAGAIALFITGVNLVMPTNSLATAEAVTCLAVGAAYIVLGLSTGWRLSVVGALLMVAVMVGWVFAREQFFLWLALAGGGGLILGGLWLRKV